MSKYKVTRISETDEMIVTFCPILKIIVGCLLLLVVVSIVIN